MNARSWSVKACAAVVVITLVIAAIPASRRYAVSEVRKLVARKTIDERLTEYVPTVEVRLRMEVERAGLAYPPPRLALLAFKDAKRLELYGAPVPGPESSDEAAPAWRFIRAYPVLAASGGPGPKLAEGDGQVPEGLYGIESLNPNSRYHLALRVSYPNADDRARARADGRERLGGDIMIHGSNASVGCLAMGDQAAEDLFVLAALAGIEHVTVVIAPSDARIAPLALTQASSGSPAWLADRYRIISDALRGFPQPAGDGAGR